MNWRALIVLAPLALAGCSSMYPPPDRSVQDAISRAVERAGSEPAGARPSASASPQEVMNDLIMPSINSLIPKSGKSSADQRFDLVVTDAPIGKVLAGLVAGTEYSMLLKAASPVPLPPTPAAATTPSPSAPQANLSDKRISLNLKNVSIFEVLNAIRDIYGYDYTVEGTRILVQPAELQTRLYYVNYILGLRRGVSDLQVIGGASVGQVSSTSTTTTSSSSSNYASVQASGLSTTVKSDIWGEAEDTLRTVLGCNIPKSSALPPTTLATTRSMATATQGNASRADVSYPGEPPAGERLRGADGCSDGRALTINQMSGTILARGMPSELRMIEKLLKSMQLSISRQVIIESKIIDVELSKDSQQGINWSAFQNGLHRASLGATPGSIGVNQPSSSSSSGGTVAGSVTLSGLLGTTLIGSSVRNGFTSGVGVAIQARNFAALINFLESQGKVHVLSSPRIATMNNQKAVIKVGSEEPFVTNISGGSTTVSTTGPTTVQPTLTYQPFFSGIALDVTPQIDVDDNITLHVHSMVNNVAEKSKLALPNSDQTVPFAVNTMNETDSVVKAKDGQVIVIGGLMTERSSDNRGGVPGIRDVPGLGGLFNKGSQSSVKRELVILLKPTVVKDDSTWSNEISAAGERLQTMGSSR